MIWIAGWLGFNVVFAVLAFISGKRNPSSDAHDILDYLE